VWKYNEGEVVAIGLGHGGEVRRVRICPNNRNIVSVGEDGSILRWRLPNVNSNASLYNHHSPQA
jgi:cilia- and flagella-associated protein 52